MNRQIYVHYRGKGVGCYYLLDGPQSKTEGGPQWNGQFRKPDTVFETFI